MQEEEHEIEELILRSRNICIKDKSYVFEHNWRDGDPKTDFEDPLDPVISIIFLILVKLSQHEPSKTYQERKQPAIDALSGGVMLIIILSIQVEFNLDIASISICNNLLGAVPQNKMICFCLGDFEVGSRRVWIAVAVEEICMDGKFLIVDY